MLPVTRRPHILAGTKTLKYPQKMIFFDTEAYPRPDGGKIRHDVYMVVGAYVRQRGQGYQEEWKDFRKPLDFWTWATAKVGKKEKLFIFAHNVTYDMITSDGFNHLKSQGFKIKNFYQKGRAFILELQRKDEADKVTGTIVVLDTGNFYEGTVAKLGEAFGLGKMEIDYENATYEEALPYCRRDVEIIKTAMLAWIRFCKEFNLGNFGKTCPSQAFNAYRHRFMKHDIYIHDRPEVCDLERQAYYGGRVECWRIGEFTGKFTYCDVNSMYPFVMKTKTFPTKLVSYRKRVSLGFLQTVIKTFQVVAKVRVKTEVPYFPLKVDNKIIFPVGEFVTVLSTPEVEKALEENLITEVIAVASYEHQPIFSEYIDFFYTERLRAKEEKNKVLDLLFKLFMNSLYGKFGQKSGGWRCIGETDREGAGFEKIFDLDKGQYISRKWLAGALFEQQEEIEGLNSFCAVAAHVTAYARMLIHGYALAAGPGNVLYMDTDSLFMTQEGYERLEAQGMINEKRLGAMKVEATTDKVFIHAPKDYQFGDMVKHKGIPKQAIQISSDTWETVFWPKLATFIRENSVGQYYNTKRTKTLRRIYNKGILEGTQVTPIRLEEKEGVVYGQDSQ